MAKAETCKTARGEGSSAPPKSLPDRWAKALEKGAGPVRSEITFTMPATPTRVAREVTQTLRAAPVVLKATSGQSKGARVVHLTAVLARE